MLNCMLTFLCFVIRTKVLAEMVVKPIPKHARKDCTFASDINAILDHTNLVWWEQIVVVLKGAILGSVMKLCGQQWFLSCYCGEECGT
ncbi:hypothetical protein FH972_008408 [Carpinus fangiana]|uniref:Secreted protein n=1 Tax=Carpinus fangiana TaxID=176857 RepID=A0A5N6QYJ9_9ROSI|nr:hypothetical protein FH972_008408 [Carpinus fangiana]